MTTLKIESLKLELLEAHESISLHEQAIKNLQIKIEKIQQNLVQKEARILDPKAKLQRIIKFDANLRELHKNLLREFVATESNLDAQLDDKESNLIDYEIDIKLEYLLPESDPSYDENSDNVLATRDVLFPYDYKQYGLNRMLQEIDSDDFHDSPSSAEYKQGYLTHDVVRHNYGFSREIGEDDLLRTKDVWVNFIITRQYCLSLETGNYHKLLNLK